MSPRQSDAPAVLPEEGTRSHDMLMRVVAHVRARGNVNVSLRQIAAGIGTSHRMLQYYFGSRENLLSLVMMRLSREYIATFAGNRPTSRAETIQGTWDMFRDPSNRLQTQILLTLAGAAAEQPDLQLPGLTLDLDNFAMALAAFGRVEGLPADRAEREGRYIVASLLGLYLDYYITKNEESVDASFQTLKGWVERSTRDASGSAQSQ
jgi:AcrR family transcriptional regulator